MGCMRSSKDEDGRSFHLRKRVQASATAPIEAATAMITVSVVLVTLLALEALLALAAAVLDAEVVESETKDVAVTVR